MEKGKREGDNSNKSRQRDEGVTNDEVEEFFTALGQMKEASKSLAQPKEATCAKYSKQRWAPTFELEDFKSAEGRNGGQKATPRRLFDLNLDPDIEEEPQAL